MHRILTLSAMLLASSAIGTGTVLAQTLPLQPVPASGHDDGQAQQYRGPKGDYVGASGARYEYDLSRPGDQIRYSLDIGAQIRDQTSADPRVDLDRSMGQVGGGLSTDLSTGTRGQIK